MTERQRNWLIIGVILAAVLVFGLFKAAPIGMRMYAYSHLDEAVLAVPVVAVECEDLSDSTEGTRIDLGYAEFYLTGDVTLTKVARHEDTGVAWGLLISGEGYSLVIRRAMVYEPYVSSTNQLVGGGGAPVGWMQWAMPSRSSDQFQQDYLKLSSGSMPDIGDYINTFEVNMLWSHIRRLTRMELATMSSGQFARYIAIALMKVAIVNPGMQTLLLHRNRARALATFHGVWDMWIWPDDASISQHVAVMEVTDIDQAKRTCGEVVSTFRLKVDADASQEEMWALFQAACEGK